MAILITGNLPDDDNEHERTKAEEKLNRYGAKWTEVVRVLGTHRELIKARTNIDIDPEYAWLIIQGSHKEEFLNLSEASILQAANRYAFSKVEQYYQIPFGTIQSVVDEAEFQRDLPKAKGQAHYLPGFTDEHLNLQRIVYQRHFKLVQALRLKRDVIKEKTGADIDPDKWDFKLDNHHELVEYLNDPDGELIPYADDYVLMKASFFFKVEENDLKEIVKDYINPLPIKQAFFQSIFNDGGYDICIELLKETGIIDSNLKTLISEGKAGHLFGVIVALKVRCKFDQNINFTERQLVEKFNEALGLKCKYHIKKTSVDFEASYDEAIDILKSLPS